MSEFVRRLRVDAIPHEGIERQVAATVEECAALAARMRIPGVRSLSCHFDLRPGVGGRILAKGRLRAAIVQSCVVTLEDVSATVNDRFVVHFVPEGTEIDEDDPESPDEIPYAGDQIDLGEAAAEQLALSLDPYPRSPGATLPEAASDPEESPFAALARLARKS